MNTSTILNQIDLGARAVPELQHTHLCNKEQAQKLLPQKLSHPLNNLPSARI